MRPTEKILFEGDSAFEHYQVVDMVYTGRPARILFSGKRSAAQSGIALDDNPQLLFDYNQRFFELAEARRPSRLLVIGGGTYTLPGALHKLLPKSRIDIVEPDRMLDALAARYFNFEPSPGMRVIHTDGRSFLENSIQKYDMILIDAFSHTTIPKSLSTIQATRHLHRNLSRHGIVAINVISAYHGYRSTILKQQAAAYQAHFNYVEIFPADGSFSLWTSQNFILIGSKDGTTVAGSMRYPKVEFPSVNESDALKDY